MNLNKPVDNLTKVIAITLISSIVFRGVLPNYTSELILIFVLSLMLISKSKGAFPKNMTFVISWTFVYILCVFLTGFYIRDISSWLTYIIYFLIGILIYLVVVFLLSSKYKIFYFMEMYTKIVIVISLLTSLAHILYLSTGIHVFLVHVGATVRSVGFYGNPNYYSVSLLVGLGFLLSLYSYGVFSKSRLSRLIFLYLSLFVLFVGIFLTFSRGALVAAIVLLLVFFMINYKEFLNIRSILSGIVLMVIIIFIDAQESQVLVQIFEQTMVRIDNAIYGTGAGRYTIWEDGFNLFSSSALFFLIGVGGNQFINYNEFNIYNHVHNGYLRFLFETGIIGFILFLILFLNMFKRTFNLMKLTPVSPVFYAFFSLLIMALSNDIFIIKEFWLIVGLISAWYNSGESTGL
ncbi:hypothetical protein BpOF4_06535 [Alkalihalophilus pseudofirmus OF4]|uniref:O-antigen ligase-related domain-containing protein n=1 Tax=Alkalihalophilus pseudofirmus (strain ATCC BAA-2126 / JCM 17055 / OF4) TaxID=398511 RepID=D3G090_ALKPO|nr:O-antigen ligase family protein [Alkalihalophilus pseudofirmus]ADC49365.1 hypothetical protein BpOF4_06535 [Alkalihalophilus pseudofirmus OF4]